MVLGLYTQLATALVCSSGDLSLSDLNPGLADGCHERIESFLGDSNGKNTEVSSVFNCWQPLFGKHAGLFSPILGGDSGWNKMASLKRQLSQ